MYEKDPVEKINKVRSCCNTPLGRGIEVGPFVIEILQGGHCLQASEAPEYFVHRRRGSRPIRIRDGVPVDGQWGFTELCGRTPRSQSLEFGASQRHQRLDSPITGAQLIGVTRGLAYLHRNEVIHGDLKSVGGGHSVVFALIDIPSFPAEYSC